MDTEDRQTEEMQVPEHDGETTERGRGGGEVNTAMQKTTQHRRRNRPARRGPKSLKRTGTGTIPRNAEEVEQEQ